MKCSQKGGGQVQMAQSQEPGTGWRWVSALVLVSKGNGKPLQQFKQGDR